MLHIEIIVVFLYKFNDFTSFELNFYIAQTKF